MSKAVYSRCFKRSSLPWSFQLSHIHLSARLDIVPASKEIRHTFFSYFNKLDHVHVPSSSIIAKKGEGTYFVNAGMNQFKPIFLGLDSPDTELSRYRRAYNSQKCIRVGGKHNDLDDVGQDCYHHTFFEMLGSWSFGDYFKENACEYAWKLLTHGYGIPIESLCVTYFGGDKEYKLSPDEETKDIWLRLGVPPERVIPFGMKDNFWDMGETGPCGPCTEIHYSHLGPLDFKHLVNNGGHDVVELWNLVFMQYNRQADGQLVQLPRKHVDTGMGLERLTAILQGKRSNYDTDLFKPIISAIEKGCKAPPYQGRIGWNDSGALDTAYRIVADHARMVTVAIGDGLLPGPHNGEFHLRNVMHRCIRQAHNSLNAPVGLLGNLVDIVVESLGDAFPELSAKSSFIKEVVDVSEAKYVDKWKEGHTIMRKVLSKLPPRDNQLPVDKVLALRDGEYGVKLPLSLLYELAEDYSLVIDTKTLEARLKEAKVQPPIVVNKRKTFLDITNLAALDENGIKATNDSYKYKSLRKNGKYEVPSLNSQVVALVCNGELVDCVEPDNECGVILDSTCFYSEQGGQISDVGTMASLDQTTTMAVEDVQIYKKYALHVGVVKGDQLLVGQKVNLNVDANHRTLCAYNHTATHLLHNALRKVLGQTVRQNGSYVGPNKLTFDCVSMVDLSSDHIREIEEKVKNMIEMDVPVYRSEIPLKEAKQLPGLVFLQDEVYPSNVWVLSVGMPVEDVQRAKTPVGLSLELCGGTHVETTKDIKAFTITSTTGLVQGSKKITAVTGDLAIKAQKMASDLLKDYTSLAEDIKKNVNQETWVERDRAIGAALGNELLPKLLRDEMFENMAKFGEVISAHDNKKTRLDVQQRLESLLMENESDAVVSMLQFSGVKSMVKAIKNTSPKQPFILFNKKKGTVTGVCHVPLEWRERGLSIEDWSHYVQEYLDKDGKCGPPKVSTSSDHVYVLAGRVPNDLNTVIDKALEYARKYS